MLCVIFQIVISCKTRFVNIDNNIISKHRIEKVHLVTCNNNDDSIKCIDIELVSGWVIGLEYTNSSLAYDALFTIYEQLNKC